MRVDEPDTSQLMQANSEVGGMEANAEGPEAQKHEYDLFVTAVRRKYIPPLMECYQDMLIISQYNYEKSATEQEKKASSKRFLKEVHQKVRPYKCIHCDHFFSRKPDLAKHVERVHLEQKPFKGFECYECEAAFERKQLLENHRNRVHLNVRSYECFLCEKSFFLKTEMKHHLKKTHNEETK